VANKRVLVTGASGRVGGIVLRALGHKYEFTALNRRPVEGVRCFQADLAQLDAILPAFEGQDAVLHLAAATGLHDWPNVLSANIAGVYNVFEAARRAGVRRVVFASSGAAILGYGLESPYREILAGQYDKVPKEWPRVNERWPVRPDSVYGASKVFGEALARYYADYHGLSMICLRLGAILADDRPSSPRAIAGYAGHADVVQIVELALDADSSIRFDLFEVVSNNRYRWRDFGHASEVLGFKPKTSSDRFIPG